MRRQRTETMKRQSGLFRGKTAAEQTAEAQAVDSWAPVQEERRGEQPVCRKRRQAGNPEFRVPCLSRRIVRQRRCVLPVLTSEGWGRRLVDMVDPSLRKDIG